MSPEDVIPKWQGVAPDGRASYPCVLVVLNSRKRPAGLMRLSWNEIRSRATRFAQNRAGEDHEMQRMKSQRHEAVR